MYDTEDDDTHLCLKCSATITGLKNYIAHRKQNCYKIVRSDSALTSVASPTTEHPYEPSTLRADDFFSSLELQSIQAVIPSTATKADHADYDLEDAEDSDNDLYPPTSHTGGKWKPGWGPTARSDWKAECQHREVPLQATKEPAAISEGFICIPCNRRYRNKFTLLRHRDTLYHLKRSGGITTAGMKFSQRRVALSTAAVQEQGRKCSKTDKASKVCDIANLRRKCPSDSRQRKQQSEKHVAVSTTRPSSKKQNICSAGAAFKLKKSSVQGSQSNIVANVQHSASRCAKQTFQRNLKLSATPVQRQKSELHCAACKVRFSTSGELRLHECHCSISRQASKKFPYGSPVSPKPSKADAASNELENSEGATDVQKQRKIAPRLFCPLCKKLISKPYMKLHLHTHTGEKPFGCHLCDKHFAHRSTLNIHIKHHLGLRRFRCTRCNFRAVRRSMLHRHELAVHRRKAGPQSLPAAAAAALVLQLCRSVRDRMSALKSEASVCKTECPLKPKPNSISSSFQCSNRKSHLEPSHQRQAMGVQRYQCSQCDYKCSHKSQMQRHSRIHFGVKPYSCPYCNYRCSNQENMRKHILHTKKHSGKKMYLCKQCTFSCNEFRVYRKHVSDKHPKDATASSSGGSPFSRATAKSVPQAEGCNARIPSNEKQMIETCIDLPEPAVFLTISDLGEPDLENTSMMVQAMPSLNRSESGLPCTESDVLAESGSGILLPSGLDTEFSDQLNAHLNDQVTFPTLDTTDIVYTPCLNSG
uniref:Putative zinc finger protein n=1 Tax=Rhipicephalus pulchellus TaxID=72859 RepID=L7LVP2_RHIPC